MRHLLVCVLATIVLAAAVGPATAAGVDATTQAAGDCSYPLELSDATGESVTIDDAPERVVALQPSDARTVYGIGAEDRLVGMPINQYTDTLETGDRTDVSVAGEQSIDAEAVIALEPDVVLAANVTLAEDVEQLRSAGLTVYQFPTTDSLDAIRENTRVVGSLTAECDGAEERIAWMDERLDAIGSALEGEERPLAFWSLGFGYSAGNETFQHEILTTAGVRNLAAEAGYSGWPEISDEVIVDRDPEWIIHGGHGSEDEPDLSEATMQTTAYEDGNVVAVNSNQVNQPAPHVVYAIEDIVEEIHPEAYAEAQAQLESNESWTDTNETAEMTTADGAANESDDAEASPGEEDNDPIPGFGVPVAVAALTSAVGLRIRR